MTHQRLLRALVAVLVATLAPFANGQEDSCPAIGVPAAKIPFTLIGDHIYTDALVNGTGPHRFIVDTGGVNLVDVRLAKQLSLRITGSEAGHGTGPGTVESGKTTVEHLTLGKVTFSGQAFYTFDFSQLYAGGGVNMMGMVGAALLRQYVTCIDFEHQVIDLIERAGFDASRAGSRLRLTTKESQLTVRGSFDGIPGVFQIDTGSPATLTLATPFVRQHGLLMRFPEHVETLSGGVGGSVREYTVRGRNLVLGGEQIRHPVTGLATVVKGNLANPDFSGIVGIGALKRYVVTFDFPGQQLFLRSYEPAPADLDSYDRSGMRVETHPSGYRVVSVSERTPAAEAGLHPGDVIVAVDGRPVGSISLPTLRDELRQRPPGTVIKLDIEAGGKRRNLTITLRNLL